MSPSTAAAATFALGLDLLDLLFLLPRLDDLDLYLGLYLGVDIVVVELFCLIDAVALGKLRRLLQASAGCMSIPSVGGWRPWMSTIAWIAWRRPVRTDM